MPSAASAANADWSLWESVLRRFESDWQRPQTPDLAEYLPEPSTYPVRLLVELAVIELEFRWRRGEQPGVEAYLQRFPELAAEPLLLELVRTEQRLRQRQGVPLMLEDWQRRFPQLQNRLPSLFAEDLETKSAVGSSWVRLENHGPPLRPQIPGVELLKEVGHGGMGVVYQARQPKLDRLVAVKTLIGLPRPHAADRFRREAEAMAQLDHPNIVPVFEVGDWTAPNSSRPIPYFIMKWLPSGSLAEVPAGQRTDPRQQVRQVETIARAVHHAHQRGVLHRDLKPSNILLDEKGEPHVADFGLAGRFDPQDPKSLTTEVVGTPAFMAPEQALTPSQVTIAADVYGLGAVLYYLLTGQPPYAGETAYATLEQAVQEQAPLPSQLNPEVARDLDIICMKCLRKEPAKRYPSAEAVAEDLARWRAGLPISARPATTMERLRAWVRRRPARAGLAVGLLLAAVLSLAALLLSHSKVQLQQQETAKALREEREAKEALASALRREQDQSYIERVSAAGRLYEMNQLGRAWAMLDTCPPHLRGWEWQYLDKLRREEPVRLVGHADWVNAAAYLPSGQVATADRLGQVLLWEPTERKLLHRWNLAKDSILSLSAHPERDLLAVASEKELCVWDASRGEQVKALIGSRWCRFSPDGHWLATVDRERVLVYSTETWMQQFALEGHTQAAGPGLFVGQELLAVAANNRQLRFWNLTTGQPAGDAHPLPSNLLAAAFADTRRELILGFNGQIYIKKLPSTDQVGQIEVASVQRLVMALAPKSGVLAFNGPAGETFLYDLEARRVRRTLRGPSRLVTAMAFSLDERWLVTGGGEAVVQLWDLKRDPEDQLLAPLALGWTEIAVAPSGRSLAVTPRSGSPPQFGTLNLIDAATGKLLWQSPGSGPASFAPDGKSIAVPLRNNAIAIYDAATGQQQRLLPAHDVLVIRLAHSPDGRWLAYGDLTGHVMCVDLTGKAPPRRKRLGARIIYDVRFVPGKSSLAVAGMDTLSFWDLDSDQIRSLPPTGGSGAYAVALNGSGTLLATADSDKVVRIRNGETGEILRSLEGHYQHVLGLTFSPDGTRLVTASADKSLRLWDVAQGKELLNMPGLSEPIQSIGWLPQQNAIVAVEDGLRVWSPK